MRGLILQGGGAKGSYEAGAIKALNQRKRQFFVQITQKLPFIFVNFGNTYR